MSCFPSESARIAFDGIVARQCTQPYHILLPHRWPIKATIDSDQIGAAHTVWPVGCERSACVRIAATPSSRCSIGPFTRAVRCHHAALFHHCCTFGQRASQVSACSGGQPISLHRSLSLATSRIVLKLLLASHFAVSFECAKPSLASGCYTRADLWSVAENVAGLVELT